MDVIIGYAPFVFMGVALNALFGVNIKSWKWWAFVIPMCSLLVIGGYSVL